MSEKGKKGDLDLLDGTRGNGNSMGRFFLDFDSNEGRSFLLAVE